MQPIILGDIWYDSIKKSALLLGQNYKKKVSNTTNINELRDVFENNGLLNTYRLLFRKIFFPNEYMRAVLQYLQDMGSASVRIINELLEDFTDKDIRNALNHLLRLHIITSEILEYTTPKPVRIYHTKFSTDDQRKEAIDYYIQDKIRWDNRIEREKKELVITHNYNKAPEKPKSKTWAEVNDKKEEKDTRVYCRIHSTYHHCEKVKEE